MKKILLTLLLSSAVTGLLHADEATVVEHVKDYTQEWRASYAQDESNFTIQEVAALLDLNREGFEQLKSLVEQEKWAAAQTELFTYFKERYKDVPVVEPMTPDQIKIAEDALGHVIKGNKNYPPAFRGVELDWTSLAVIDGKTINSKEWLYQYHRKGWWKPLSDMYTLHQDERYFNEWLYEMITYYRAFPDLSTAPKYASRGMETFGRTASYLDSIPHMIHSDQFTEEVLLLYLGTFHKSTEHIRAVYSGKGNHLVSELTQVLVNAVELPEFKKAAEWKAEAMRRLPEQIELCMFEDGMNREFVFSYHTFYIQLFSTFYEIVKQYNLESELPESYAPILENMHTVYGEFTLPDFTVPQFGDAWKYRKIVNGVPESRYGYLIETYSKRYPENEVLAYFAKKYAGEEATPPAVKNAYYPQSGFYSLRSGWDEASVIMAIKNTEGEKIWHNQPDNGTFLLYANGRNFMSDSGCFIYDSPVPEEQEWRAYFKATRNHQTLTLDNENVSSKPYPPEVKETDRGSDDGVAGPWRHHPHGRPDVDRLLQHVRSHRQEGLGPGHHDSCAPHRRLPACGAGGA